MAVAAGYQIVTCNPSHFAHGIGACVLAVHTQKVAL